MSRDVSAQRSIPISAHQLATFLGISSFFEGRSSRKAMALERGTMQFNDSQLMVEVHKLFEGSNMHICNFDSYIEGFQIPNLGHKNIVFLIESAKNTHDIP